MELFLETGVTDRHEQMLHAWTFFFVIWPKLDVARNISHNLWRNGSAVASENLLLDNEIWTTEIDIFFRATSSLAERNEYESARQNALALTELEAVSVQREDALAAQRPQLVLVQPAAQLVQNLQDSLLLKEEL